ncbi:MAG: M48 family metallopeptidase [Rikenellaceae bacterium]|nr:M48 family metallopeptidase [Rikenellaceae bacterium]
MAEEYIHPELGAIRLQRRVGCRRISISVGRGGRITVTRPWFVSERTALEFVNKKIEWIVAARQRAEKSAESPTLTTGYRTRTHTLRIESGARNSYTITADEVVVTLTSQIDPTSEAGQQMIRTAVIETLRAEAHAVLPPMVERLAAQHGFSYNGLTVKNIHSKWGSCSTTNHLNFSLYLMLLPDELIEFVVLHELCHTIHKNHSVRFHALLNSIVGGNEQSLNRKLRQFRTTL